MSLESNLPSQEDEQKIREARAEYARLQVKRRENTDKDVRAALDLRMQQITAEFGPEVEVKQVKVKKAPSISIPERKDPPTPEELREAEGILARSRLELTRGNSKSAHDLLMQAVEMAPGAPSDLEALGDYYLEKNMFDAAKIECFH